MTRTYEKDDRPIISTKSTSPNFQARPFGPPQSAVSQVNQTAEGQSIQPKSLLPESLLGKGLFTPRPESSGRPVQRQALFSRRTTVQAKLNIGEPDDKYEKEADTIAADAAVGSGVGPAGTSRRDRCACGVAGDHLTGDDSEAACARRGSGGATPS